MNITYGGGCQNISWSTLSDNVGSGLALWVNETTINTPVRQQFVLAYSNISLNYDIGVVVGNFCGPSVVNVSGNYFDYGRLVLHNCFRLRYVLSRTCEGTSGWRCSPAGGTVRERPCCPATCCCRSATTTSGGTRGSPSR